MYQVGEYVMYGNEGVCCVRFVGHPDVPGLQKQKEYYCLEALRHKSMVYTPLDTRTTMRPVSSSEELTALFEAICRPDMRLALPADAKSSAEVYRAILQEMDFLQMLRLYQALLLRQRQQVASHKTLSATDQRFLRQTEDLLCSEIGFVFNLKLPAALSLLRENCG